MFHQLLEVGAGQGGPLRPEDVSGCGEHHLHGSGAKEGGVVLDEQVYPRLLMLLVHIM